MIEKLGDKLDPSMLGNRLSLPLPVGTSFFIVIFSDFFLGFEIWLFVVGNGTRAVDRLYDLCKPRFRLFHRA